ncbi:Lrp/AsnC family transcriptional regulator [Lichenicoccus roseus]|uniref:Lrp/AsnC family transcriptional regulator n=1 Tax=Lichenicoccus roseus TaxID=2683649 RepID=A0A5R9J6S9_9PROT|nr:Lrp/AsnC family transcriptional regulator [Lichenicoccus roseus]
MLGADVAPPAAHTPSPARAVHAVFFRYKVHTIVTELDAIDRRIVAELQEDGRITNVELARRAGISAPPCLRRVRRLEELGVIRGYHGDSDPQLLGWAITFFALIGLDSQKDAVLAGFEAMVAEWPEVRECHMIRGGGDFLLRLVARDTVHENQLTRRLTEAVHVSRVQTLQTIRTSRNLVGVPVEPPDRPAGRT